MQLDIINQTAVQQPEIIGLGNLLIGKSPRMDIVRALIAKVAANDSTVLITGESGTGKELAARAIHNLSSRSDRPFVPVNCGAIPEELLESELFGHVRGAFTGAVNGRQGRFQLANGGTLFLDEIGEMSPKLQVKLLRVLQEHECEPVGSDHTVPVDVRVVTATHRDLRVATREGRFREDLFYRLNVLPLELPALRERDGDIPLLIRYFLHAQGRRRNKSILQIDDTAMSALRGYNWPGNVRELENLVERVVVLNDDGVIRPGDLPDYILNNAVPQHQQTTELALPTEGVDLDGVLEKIENGFIERALERARGNKTMAAELLRLNRTTFIERLRKKGMLQSARGANLRPANGKIAESNFSMPAPRLPQWNLTLPTPVEA